MAGTGAAPAAERGVMTAGAGDEQPTGKLITPQPSPREEDPPTPSTGPYEGAAGGSLTRVTANFTPRAMAALEKVAAETGDSKTDILNRSVMVYEVFLDLMEQSEGTLQVVYPDGSKERLRFLG